MFRAPETAVSRRAVTATVLAAGALAVALPGWAIAADLKLADIELDYAYTGALETYVVPDGYCRLNIEASGAGGASAARGGQGGHGASVQVTVDVTAGDTVGVDVGQQGRADIPAEPVGAYGGGGIGGSALILDDDGFWVEPAGGGGGRTVVSLNGVDLVVAGGGGGGASSIFPDPAAGGDAGRDGEQSPVFTDLYPGGAPGSSGDKGGTGGVNEPGEDVYGKDGTDAQGPIGGDGGDMTGTTLPITRAGAGGGGGAVGGGGGAAAPLLLNGGGGGGGGSSQAPAGAQIGTVSGLGDGSVHLMVLACDELDPAVGDGPTTLAAAPSDGAGYLATSGRPSALLAVTAAILVAAGGLLTALASAGRRRWGRDLMRP